MLQIRDGLVRYCHCISVIKYCREQHPLDPEILSFEKKLYIGLVKTAVSNFLLVHQSTEDYTGA